MTTTTTDTNEIVCIKEFKYHLHFDFANEMVTMSNDNILIFPQDEPCFITVGDRKYSFYEYNNVQTDPTKRLLSFQLEKENYVSILYGTHGMNYNIDRWGVIFK